MKIFHFILGKANPNRANGVNQVVYNLATNQVILGHYVTVIGLSKSTDRAYEVINRGLFDVEVYKNFNIKCINRIKDVIKNCDIVHLHGVWNIYNVLIGKYCREQNKPYVITPHGAYIKENVETFSFFRKMLFHNLFAKKLFNDAAFVHALTKEEATDIIYYCRKENIVVVPNGISLDNFKKIYQLKNNKIIKLGYIGRLSPEKNIFNLVKSISLLSSEIKDKVELHLIGPLENNVYMKKMKTFIKKNNLQDIVNFDGPAYGNEKIQKLLEMDIYIHPALTEGFSIAILEVLALGIPSILTRTSNMSYYYNSNAFIMAEPTAFDLAFAIEEIVKRRDEWKDLSERSRDLVKNRLTWEIITKKLCNEYKKYI